MKKVLLSMVVALGITGVANAQMGSAQINAGIGFDSWKGVPVYAGADYFVTDDISVGGEVSYASVNNYNNYDTKFSIFGIGANGNYHFNQILELPSEWDLYAGVSLNYYNWSYDSKINGIDLGGNNGINPGGQIGARYFFSPNLGINLQFGGGSNVSGGKLGITYKL